MRLALHSSRAPSSRTPLLRKLSRHVPTKRRYAGDLPHRPRYVTQVTQLIALTRLTALRKSKTTGVRYAAITICYGAHSLQFSSFVNRNRAYAVLLRYLIPGLPHLAASWHTPSSARLQQRLSLPASEICLHEIACTVDRQPHSSVLIRLG